MEDPDVISPVNSEEESKTPKEFNAAKTGKIPESSQSPAPKSEPAVKVAYIRKKVGYGLVAARDIAAGEFIFHERPLVEAPYNEDRAAPDQAELLEAQYQAFLQAINDPYPVTSYHMRNIVTAAFPNLMRQLDDKVLQTWDQFRDMLNIGFSRNMIHGELAESDFTRSDWDRLRRNAKYKHHPTHKSMREACGEFFRDYGFHPHGPSVLAGTSLAKTETGPAYVYILASLINHCCHVELESEPQPEPQPEPKKSRFLRFFSSLRKKPPAPAAVIDDETPVDGTTSIRGPNCEWQIGPFGLAKFVGEKNIAVKAKRDIREGEELTWHYGKRNLPFKCKCRTCKPVAR